MFVWTVVTTRRRSKAHLPDHARLLFPLGDEWGTPAWNRRLRPSFPRVPKISNRLFGVMGKGGHVSV